MCGGKEFRRTTKLSAALCFCLSSGLSAQSLEVNVFAGISDLTHYLVEFTGWADVEGIRIKNVHGYGEIVANEPQVISALMPMTRS